MIRLISPMMVRAFLFVFLLSLVSFSQKTGESKDSVSHSLGPRYTDETVGIELLLPDGWYIADPKEIEVWSDKGRQDLKNNYKLPSQAIIRNKITESIQLLITKKPLGDTKNAVLGFSTVSQPSESITAKMVAEATKSLFLKDHNNSLVMDISTLQINGREFAMFEFEVRSDLGKQKVRIFIVNQRAKSITFALNYWDSPDDLALMTKAVESIKFVQK